MRHLYSAAIFMLILSQRAQALPAAAPRARPSPQGTTKTTTVAQNRETAAEIPPSAPEAFSSPKRFSLSVALPDFETKPLSNAFGARLQISNDVMISALVVFSDNTGNEKDKTLFGVGGKIQRFLGASARARPYLAASAYVWKPGGDANEPHTKTAVGVAAAGGAEVWFIPEFSAFLETGIFLDSSHREDSKTEIGTFTTSLGVNINFEI